MHLWVIFIHSSHSSSSSFIHPSFPSCICLSSSSPGGFLVRFGVDIHGHLSIRMYWSLTGATMGRPVWGWVWLKGESLLVWNDSRCWERNIFPRYFQIKTKKVRCFTLESLDWWNKKIFCAILHNWIVLLNVCLISSILLKGLKPKYDLTFLNIYIFV